MPKTDSFDDNVDRYESWFERNRLVYESELEAIRDLLQPCGRGLEIGAQVASLHRSVYDSA
ncbi:MAG: hypothetical protein COX16_09940 [Deltaproteobacteria bacterium CG23_combo_of_CG06-09_8_20_14_all_51_20]|nr:hypothetical protein [bacterium]NCP07799.1 hypothetical protein [bacterium]PIP46150.1 MAG: hypothetical protein COX16_09940 [Deltaproteobacteria bacterium CG23_combo_of_CG06-09_8_20_14_all_51_20]PJB34421.1 MAG: hypothetical protein CO107_13255 [Deltaproteobacteria bacterium CG_4_9_14_3_um_filter_51_14]